MRGRLHRSTAPRYRIDVGERLRERPQMSAQIHDGVLTLAIRISRRAAHYARRTRYRVLVMCIDIGDAQHHRMGCPSGSGVTFQPLYDDDAPGTADTQLSTMVGDTQPFTEPKHDAEPFRGGTYIGV